MDFIKVIFTIDSNQPGDFDKRVQTSAITGMCSADFVYNMVTIVIVLYCILKILRVDLKCSHHTHVTLK